MKRTHVSLGFLFITAMLAVACGDDTGGGGGAGGAGTGGASSQASTGDGSPSSSSSGMTSGGASGGGGSGAGELTCTLEDRPPFDACPEDADFDEVNELEDCVVEIADGGCPNTTVTWRCTPGEGGNHWEREIDTHCDCTALVDDQTACEELPGCVWALPGIEECGADPYDASPVPAEGCYRTDCGTSYWDLYGRVGGSCDFDLCATDD